jgi:hypothetical protein
MPGSKPYAFISVGQQDPSPIRITLNMELEILDSPETLQDFARQALAQVCEGV